MIRRLRPDLATRFAVAASALALLVVVLIGFGAWLATAGLMRSQVRELVAMEAALRAARVADVIADLDAHTRLSAATAATAADTRLHAQALVDRLPARITVTDRFGRVVAGEIAGWSESDASWAAQAMRSSRRVGRVGAGATLEVAVPTASPRGLILVWQMRLGDLARRAAEVPGAGIAELMLVADGVEQVVSLGERPPGAAMTAEAIVALPPELAAYRLSIRVAAEDAMVEARLDRLRIIFLMVGAAAALSVVLIAALMGRRLARPLSRLAAAATAFAAGGGDGKALTVRGEDEIARLGAAFAGMVDRLGQASGELERRSWTLLSNTERVAQVGSAVWQPDGRQMWSDQFHAILGLTPGETDPGRAAFFARVHDGDRAMLAAVLDGAFDRPVGGVVEDFRIMRPDGGERVAQLRAELAQDAEGRPLRLDVTIQDITERKRMEQRLDAAIRELKRSNEELEQFAYVASHDLRQPLRTVRSYVSLIEDGIDDKLDDETREFMDFIRDGVRRMDALITDLLSYSRVGRSGGDGPVDTGRAVDLALIDLQAEIDEAGAQVRVPERMPVVSGDGGEMTRLFQNLIGNAVKYRSPERAPEVDISVLDLGDQWEFLVTDNGIGIPPEHYERIFGIFQRLHARHEFEGTGIGLAICRKVVERQGGRIWGEPGAGCGAVFHFTWPKRLR